MTWLSVHIVRALDRFPQCFMSGVRTLCIGAVLATAIAVAPAKADCPAAPVGSANDLVVSFLAAHGAQIASSVLLPSSVKEGMLVYDNTDDALKVCNGTAWIEVGSGGGATTLAALTDIDVTGVSNGKVLTYNSTSSKWEAVTPSGGTAAGSIAGAVQFRGSSAVFAADDANLVWDDTNNRLGIGTATPATALSIGTGQLSAPAGTATAPSYTFSGNPNTGIWSTITNAISFSVNGAETVRMQPTVTYFFSSIQARGTDNEFGPNDNGNVTGQHTIIRGAAGNGTNLAGPNLTIQAGNGTGSGGSGNLIFRTAPPGASGTTQNSMTERLIIDPSGNVGIGTAAPSVMLDVQSANNVDGLAVGTAANAVSYLLIRGTNGTLRSESGKSLILQSPGVASMYLQTNGANRLTLDSTGNVGIGTTSPQHILHLARSGSSAAAIIETNHSAGRSNINFQTSSGTSSSKTAVASGRTLGEISAAGYDGAGYFDAGMIAVTADGTVSTGVVPGRIVLSTADSGGTLTERMRISSSGNVGIGTASPGYKLDVDGSLRISNASTGPTFWFNGPAATNRQMIIQSAASNRWTVGVTNGAESGSNAGTDFIIGRFNDAGTYVDAPLNIQRSTGNVGIGSASTSYKLTVETSTGYAISGYTTAAGGNIGVYGRTSSTASHAALFHNTGSNYYCYMGYLNTYSIICSGPASIPSDMRLKKDVVSLTSSDGLDALMKLRPVSYHWNDTKKGNRLEFGFIAQEVETIMPNLVGEVAPTTDAEKAAAHDGQLKTMQYEGLIAPLVKSVQELKAANDNLKADNDNQAEAIEELRREIDALKATR